MGKLCQSCHARIDEGMKICPNCGKVVPTVKRKPSGNVSSVSKKAVTADKSQRSTVGTANSSRRVQRCEKRQVQEQYYENPDKNYYEQETAEKKHKKKKHPRLSAFLKAIKIAVTVLVIYAVLTAGQLFRVKHSTCDFDTAMEMSKSNYGEATEGYLEDIKWSYNPLTFTAVCKGTHDNESYEISFDAKLTVKVKSISVDGEKVTGKKLQTRLMGMFI